MLWKLYVLIHSQAVLHCPHRHITTQILDDTSGVQIFVQQEGLEARESEVTALAARVANLELEAAQLAVQNAALEQDASSIDMVPPQL